MLKGLLRPNRKSIDTEPFRSDVYLSGTAAYPDLTEKRQTKADMKRMVEREERRMREIVRERSQKPAFGIDQTPSDTNSTVKRQTKAEMKKMVEEGERSLSSFPRSQVRGIPSEVYVTIGVILCGIAIIVIGQMKHIIHLAQ